MKANELQIGDYVNYRGQIIKVTSLYDKGGSNEVGWSDKESVWVNADNVEPIPLTPEILNKNFPKPNGDYWVEGDFPIIGYSIPCITDGNCPYVEVSIYDPARVMEFEMFFHYVHELQHALRLCGIEKEIEL